MTKSQVSLKPFFTFLLLAYGLTWVFWIPAVLLRQELMTFPTIVLHTLGGFGPSLAGILMVYRMRDRAGWKDFWRRVVDLRQVGLHRSLLILAFFPLLALLAIALSSLVGAPAHLFTTILRIAANPLLLLVMLLAGLIGGPVAEELGWRGFALDIVQVRWNAALSSLVLGFFWWGWHLPLFFIPGTVQHGLGVNTLDFWLFAINPIPLSLLFAWVYYRTGRSILSAILMHLSFNFAANLFYPLSPQAAILHAGLLFLAMLLGLVVWNSKPTRLPGLNGSQTKAWRKDL
jgi:uncharacterized protein